MAKEPEKKVEVVEESYMEKKFKGMPILKKPDPPRPPKPFDKK